MFNGKGGFMDDDEFIARFEECTLSPECFHHADHVRMAFLYLRRYPVLEAIGRFSGALLRFATAAGKPGRYHETITWAFLFLIHERIAQLENPPSWAEFAENNRDLLAWEGGVLKKYYRDETLVSDFARRTFVFPDRF
jgi:hypothetical protein